MDYFKDVYSINFGEDFYKLSINKKKEIFEIKLKEYLKNKIRLQNEHYFNENSSIYALVETTSKYYGDEAVADLVHAVLNISSNLQGYYIVWYCNEKFNIHIENKGNKWESLKTNESLSNVEVFNIVYDNFKNNFMKNYDNLLLDRFMRYISIPTSSNSNSKSVPSSKEQIYFAEQLYDELKVLGVKAIFDKEHGYVYAKIDGDKDIPSIGFISHMDTSEDAKGHDINPLIIEKYDGNDIAYKDKTILRVKDNFNLKEYVGKTLITTDGTTLLGADDKAGIAEIMGMVEYYSKCDDVHGDIYIAFTPDEEIGRSIDFLDRNIFNPKFAYTIDGECLGELSFENFNAADVNIKIHGNNVHPGYAYNKMVNSMLIANMLNNLLPKYETPNNTEKYEGFYHLHKINGTVSETEMFYLIRDFDEVNFQYRINVFKEIVNELNKRFNNCIEMNVNMRYKNMKEVISNYPEVIDVPKVAMEKMGIEPYYKSIRGGTDGTRLSFEGIPCPNIGAGGHNFHSTQEFVCLEDMEKIQELLINIVKEYYLTYKKNNNNTLKKIK